MNLKPSARKTHRKTRTGCRTCKSRKIKCDEQRPNCHNCVKHSVQCDFQIAQSIGGAHNSGRGVSEVTNSPYSGSTGSVPVSKFGGDTPQGLNNVQAIPRLNLLDLELLHNFVTSTSNTLYNDPLLKALWKVNIPQLGFKYDFVMRGILALSALHLARHKPAKRDLYTSQAMLQHQTGLREATSVLTELNDENCTGVYIFSALTLFYTVASPRKPEDFLLVGENGIADWLTMVKRTRFIVKTTEETLWKGTLGPMFSAGKRRVEIRDMYLAEAEGEEDPLAELQQFVQKTTVEREDAEIYIDAIHTLRQTFITFKEPGQGKVFESADIFQWVFNVNDRYLELLREYRHEALCIFGYFCVALRRLDSYWWMEGWATHLISKIYYQLDEEHRLWIRWPIEEIGWIPN